MSDEAALLEQLKIGDTHAFKQVVDEYSPRVYRLALNMLGDPLEAEDVLQETFLNAFRGFGRFRGDSALGTWIYRIATNASLMHLRRRRAPALSLDDTNGDGELYTVTRPVPEWSLNPEEMALNAEVRQVMDKAVADLSEGLRIVFLLRDTEGLSTAEVADALDVSESAVKSRLHRARLLLRDRLSQYFAQAEAE